MKGFVTPDASPQTSPQATLQALTSRVTALLRTHLTLAPHQFDEDFVESGLLDSAGFMELFCVLEQTFGIVIDADDLDLANFRTLPAMVGFIRRKLNGTAHGAAGTAGATGTAR